VLPHGGGPIGQDPILLQKGDEVEMVMSVMHIDRDIWGDDVMEFKPERWRNLKQS
jgi:cytochrome P450